MTVPNEKFPKFDGCITSMLFDQAKKYGDSVVRYLPQLAHKLKNISEKNKLDFVDNNFQIEI